MEDKHWPAKTSKVSLAQIILFFGQSKAAKLIIVSARMLVCTRELDVYLNWLVSDTAEPVELLTLRCNESSFYTKANCPPTKQILSRITKFGTICG